MGVHVNNDITVAANRHNTFEFMCSLQSNIFINDSGQACLVSSSSSMTWGEPEVTGQRMIDHPHQNKTVVTKNTD